MRVRKEPKPISVECIDCGEVFTAFSRRALRCEKCRELAKKKTSAEWMKDSRSVQPKRKPKTHPKMSIREVLKAMDKYNKEHGTHLTYGKYQEMRFRERRTADNDQTN